MKTEQLLIGNIPAILWGKSTGKLYLYIHGQGGNKEEAELLANLICESDWQVLSIDLPGHGSRKDEIDSFTPWHVVPELHSVMNFAKSRVDYVSLFANSIGAWFSMLAFRNEEISECMFVSPVLDMKNLILKFMAWANVSPEQLQKERVIPTTFGQTLTWEYWSYVLANPVNEWNIPTKILYGGKDNLVDRNVIENFSRKFDCSLTVIDNAEHWFHTEEQLAALTRWITKNVGEE